MGMLKDDAAMHAACRSALVDLSDPAWRVRAAACRAVGACGGRIPGAVESLLTVLDDDNLLVQCAAAAALGSMRPGVAPRRLAEAVEVSAALLYNPDVPVRVAAAEAVGRLSVVAD